MNITRRIFLKHAPIAVGAVSVSAVASASVEMQSMREPTREELEDYLLFLWSEHRRLAGELGIDPYDHMLSHRRGWKSRYESACADPASTRASAVLSRAGVGREG